MNKIFWAADSTVQTNDFTTYPQTGIGQVFPLFVKNEYQIVNHAKNGRSTKSFMDEGRLKAIEEQIGAGDFLFIQFGHNDEKKEDPTRYTEPFSTYMENLETFIRVAKDHSAYPVLITPLERRCFMDEIHQRNIIFLRGLLHSSHIIGMCSDPQVFLIHKASAL